MGLGDAAGVAAQPVYGEVDAVAVVSDEGVADGDDVTGVGVARGSGEDVGGELTALRSGGRARGWWAVCPTRVAVDGRMLWRGEVERGARWRGVAMRGWSLAVVLRWELGRRAAAAGVFAALDAAEVAREADRGVTAGAVGEGGP